MHYLIGVVIDPQDDTDTAVEKALRPYCENDGDNEDGWWDWYTVGGRWTGVWSDYEPDKDAVNSETCWLCKGTGTRDDMVVANGCNGCRGEGVAVKWATQWAPFSGDRLTVDALLARDGDLMPSKLVLPDGPVMEHETWNGEDFITTPDWADVARRALEPYRAAHIVAVDVHS